jgi:hypothetical protein
MNPELRRYLWLELGLHRRIAAPLVLLLVFGLFAANAGPGQDWRGELYRPAIVIAFVMLYLWGARQAAESVAEELRDRTWDLQRLSALGPWEMTWGKLAGSTVFAWFTGGICLVVAVVASGYTRESRPAGWVLLALVAGAVMVHGAALGAGLQAVRKDAKSAQRFGTLFLLVPLILPIWVLSFADAGDAGAAIDWHGLAIGRLPFAALSLVAFAAWAVYFAYRSMCRELQVRTLPWAWPCFALYVAFWLAGLAGGRELGAFQAFVVSGVLACTALTYAALFTDLTSAMVIRRMAAHAARGDWRRALEAMPVWPTTLVLGFAFALAAPVAFAQAGTYAGAPHWSELHAFATRAPIALLLLALRDCAILVFFASALRPRRVEGVTLLYLALLWWLIPALLGALGLTALAQLVNPFISLDGAKAASVMAAQAAIATGLAAWRWRRHYGRPRG